MFSSEYQADTTKSNLVPRAFCGREKWSWQNRVKITLFFKDFFMRNICLD